MSNLSDAPMPFTAAYTRYVADIVADILPYLHDEDACACIYMLRMRDCPYDGRLVIGSIRQLLKTLACQKVGH